MLLFVLDYITEKEEPDAKAYGLDWKEKQTQGHRDEGKIRMGHRRKEGKYKRVLNQIGHNFPTSIIDCLVSQHIFTKSAHALVCHGIVHW